MHADRAIAQLASRQHGVVALGQLAEAGVGESEVLSRERSGHLHRLYRGVYAAGHVDLSREGRWLAATLACDAVLSHRCSAAHMRLRSPAPGPIDVSALRRTGRVGRARTRRADLWVSGVRVHRPSTLRPEDIVVVDGIRCTSVPRTILDVAASADCRELERLLDEAAHLEVLSLQALEEVIASVSRPRGVRLLRTVLEEHDAGTTRTQSALEERYLWICATYGLPKPAMQVPVALGDGRYAYADALYAEERVIVELDGPGHDRPRRRRYDAWRDGRLEALGFVVLRFDETALDDRPAEVARRIRDALARRGPRNRS